MRSNDYIDTVVLAESPKATQAAWRSQFGTRRHIARMKDVRLTRVGDVEINSLAIEEGPDSGDPYNNTGKHCVLKIRKG